MRFSGLSSILVVLVIFVVNDSVNGVLKDVANKVNDKVGTVVEKAVCNTVTSVLEKLGESLNKVFQCDDKDEAYCKVINNKALVFSIICAIAEDQRKELLEVIIKCAKIADSKKKEECKCQKELVDALMKIPKAAEMMKGAGR